MEIDWHKLFFSDHPYSFFIEILIRTPLMFLAVVLILRLTGKRGVQQLSIFEMVMIISLGSAAGDSMFYEDVGIFHALAVFALILLLYRIIIYAIAKSEKVEFLLEGKPLYLLRDGKMCLDEIDGNTMGADEFFGELRNQSIEHLGQLRYVILEDTGKLSIFYLPDHEVKPGLPILPDSYNKKKKKIEEHGLYACARCGGSKMLPQSDLTICDYCKNDEWVKAIDNKRIV
jgi:uncharacterized membrane protein YcaP (DUF421 family)